jgi:hypothetical protein
LTPRLDALRRTFAEPVSGPAYRPVTRVVAGLLVAGLLGWGVRTLLMADEPPDTTRLGTAAVIALALLWPMPMLLFGRTVVDADGIRQPGLMGREIRWTEVQRIRFVRMPMSPRLMASSGFGRVKVFHSGSRELDQAFAQAVRLMTAPLEEIGPP